MALTVLAVGLVACLDGGPDATSHPLGPQLAPAPQAAAESLDSFDIVLQHGHRTQYRLRIVSETPTTLTFQGVERDSTRYRIGETAITAQYRRETESFLITSLPKGGYRWIMVFRFSGDTRLDGVVASALTRTSSSGGSVRVGAANREHAELIHGAVWDHAAEGGG